MVVDQDCDATLRKPGYYQVILSEAHFERVRERLNMGVAVLVRGRILDGTPSTLDAAWNHRIVTAESLDVLYGTLRQGRSFQLPIQLEPVTE